MLPFSKKTTYLLLIAASLAAVSVCWHLVSAATSAIPQLSNDLSQEIKDLNSTIDQKKKQLDQIKAKQDEYQQAINTKHVQQADLKNQLSRVDNRLAGAQLQLDQVKIDVQTTSLEIQKTNLEISENDKLINQNKEQLSSAIKLLSQEGDRSQLEVLLLNNYLTEYISQVKDLEDINGKITEGLSSLKLAKDGLATSRTQLDLNKEKLSSLRQELEGQQVQLASEKDAKSYLLDETKSSESEYQKLLQQAKNEQDAASADIVNLERSIRAKMSQPGSRQIPLNYSGLIWPIDSRRITAYFHDPSYPFIYLFQHPAIDISTPQGTPIRAAASGYVGTAHDGGMGYSYIMIVHGDGLATVYGHVSRIYVKANDYVSQGQVIGNSGAMPGTPGAGPFTTGPHLHLEVRLNGIPVNPLEYLPGR